MPTISSPALRHPGRLQNAIATPTPTMGRAMSAMENLNPSAAIIHAVVVVPRFAPIITPIPSRKVKRPAFTNPTTIIVVAAEACITVVITHPENTPLNRFPAIVRIMERNLSPESFCKPSLIIFIPNRNNPRLPII